MKKILSLTFTVLMLLCLTACSAQPTQTAVFIPGTTEGNTYKSEFLGIGIDLPSSYTFYTQEEIAEINGIAAEVIGEEYTKALETAQIFYDMYVSNQKGDSININFENLTIAGTYVADAESYLNLTKDQIAPALESMGYTELNVTIGEASLAGQSHPCLDVTAKIGGFEFYETIICIKIDNYVSAITVASFDVATINELISSFYAL